MHTNAIFLGTILVNVYFLLFIQKGHMHGQDSGKGHASTRSTRENSSHAPSMHLDANISTSMLFCLTPTLTSWHNFTKKSILVLHTAASALRLRLLPWLLTTCLRVSHLIASTHKSSHLAGLNSLLLAGYTNHQIQKMRQLKGSTFKEYIHADMSFWKAFWVT